MSYKDFVTITFIGVCMGTAVLESCGLAGPSPVVTEVTFCPRRPGGRRGRGGSDKQERVGSLSDAVTQ